MITLAYDGSIGECFYQSEPFFASEKIVTMDIKQVHCIFLIPILKLESQMYSYGGRKWTVETQLKATNIQLPVCKDTKEPDYEFMENYIKSLAFSSNI